MTTTTREDEVKRLLGLAAVTAKESREYIDCAQLLCQHESVSVFSGTKAPYVSRACMTCGKSWIE